MPRRGNEYEYASSAVYGNVAYDLNRYGNAQPAPEYDYEPQPQEQPRIRPVKRTQAVEETRQGLSLFAIVGFGALTALMVLILMAYVELTSVTAQTAQLREELAEAVETKAQLEIKYENAFDLEQVEEYAVGTLGMVKPSEKQITVLDGIRSDKAEILSGGGEGGILRTVLTAVLEYFR